VANIAHGVAKCGLLADVGGGGGDEEKNAEHHQRHHHPKARSISHWFPYDPVRVVNVIP
jgi:hypothetical protein